MCKTIVEITPKNDKSIYIQFKGTPKPISGHRFTALLGLESNLPDSKLTFDLFGLRFQPETRVMELGKVMESTCIDYLYGDEIYLTYGFNEYNGNALDLENKYDVNGLPDAIIPEKNMLVENKVTTRFRMCLIKWKKQAQFYAYWWNKLRSQDTGIKIDKIQVARYYVDENDLDWQLEHPDNILPENIETYDVDLDTEQIEEDMETAKVKRDQLINSKIEIRKNYTQLLKWLAIGSAKGLIKFKVDQDIPVCKQFMEIINKYVKEERSKENVD